MLEGNVRKLGAGYASRASLLMRPPERTSGRTVSMVGSRTSLIFSVRWPREW